MATAKRLPSGNWRVQVFSHTETIVGKDGTTKEVPRYESFTAPTKKEAEFLAAQFKMTKKRKKENKNVTFSEACDQFISAKSNVLSPSTIRGYSSMQKNNFLLLMAEDIYNDSFGILVQKQINQNAKNHSVKSLHNQYGFITAVLGFFGVELKNVFLPAKQTHNIPVPSKQEIEKILHIIHEDKEIECQVLLALTCSLRQSEISALTPKNISGNIVEVCGARVYNKDHKLVWKPTNKTEKSNRKVAMPNYLADLMHQQCEKVKDGFLFSQAPKTVLKRFKKLLTENDLPPYTIHSLRHAFAALAHYQKTPDKYIMQMGGWSSDYVMKRVYQYAFDRESQEMKENMNNFFDQNLSQ